MLLPSCNDAGKTAESYYAFLEDEDNGLCVTKEVIDLQIKVKYLPAEYLCYKELKGDSDAGELKNEIIEDYKYNASFLVTIGPSESSTEKFDITRCGVNDMNEFNQRAQTLNFHMGNYFSLTFDGIELKPAFCEMENVYGLTPDRKFNVVFTPQENKNEIILASDMTLTYKDELFNSGLSKFKFFKEDIENVPEIQFWNETKN